MTQEIYVRKFIAVGQKTHSSEPYGQGFNYWVEIGLPIALAAEPTTFANAKTVIDQVLAQIDHQALGVDVHLGFAPDSVALCQWVRHEVARQCHCDAVSVRMIRGDGLSFFTGPGTR